MATALSPAGPEPSNPSGPTAPDAPRGLAAELGRLLLDALRDHPLPWPEAHPTEDVDEPAVRRRALRRSRRQEQG